MGWVPNTQIGFPNVRHSASGALCMGFWYAWATDWCRGKEPHTSSTLYKNIVVAGLLLSLRSATMVLPLEGTQPMRKVRQPVKSLTPPLQQRQPRLTSFQRDLQRHMKCSAQSAAWFDALLSRESPSKMDH